MPKKQTHSGLVNVHNTTRLQLESLVKFAFKLGYVRGTDNQFRPFRPYSLFKGITKLDRKFGFKQRPRIDFNTMVKWHNGIFKRNGLFKSMEETLRQEGLPLDLYNEALAARKVKQIKIQRKKDTTLVIQDHLVEIIK